MSFLGPVMTFVFLKHLDPKMIYDLFLSTVSKAQSLSLLHLVSLLLSSGSNYMRPDLASLNQLLFAAPFI